MAYTTHTYASFVAFFAYIYVTLHFFPCNILNLNDVLERALK